MSCKIFLNPSVNGMLGRLGQSRNISNGAPLRNEPNSLKTAIFTRFAGALHRRSKPLQVSLREPYFRWAGGLSHKPSVSSKIIFAKKLAINFAKEDCRLIADR
jgi:hypothetical protein